MHRFAAHVAHFPMPKKDSSKYQQRTAPKSGSFEWVSGSQFLDVWGNKCSHHLMSYLAWGTFYIPRNAGSVLLRLLWLQIQSELVCFFCIWVIIPVSLCVALRSPFEALLFTTLQIDLCNADTLPSPTRSLAPHALGPGAGPRPTMQRLKKENATHASDATSPRLVDDIGPGLRLGHLASVSI